MELYPDQVSGVNAIVAALREGYKKVVFKLPTGGGKTVVASHIITRSLAKGNRVAFVVDAISLIDQTVDRFIQAGIPSEDIGVLQGSHERTDIARPVQIVSIDTLRCREQILTLPAFADNLKLIIYDECHCQKAFIYEWMKRWNMVTFLGLSATPYAKGMGKHWETMVIGGTLRDMISSGRLSQYRVFAPSHPDLSQVRVQRGDYVAGDLADTMNKGALVRGAVDNWVKLGEDRPTLVFCVNRTHAKHVQQQFGAKGIAAGYIDAYTELDERREIGEKFHTGELKVVCSVGCLTKGVDWDVRCILLLRPTKSEMLFLQIIGRGLRTAEDKDDCLILDHSDTFLRLGFPEDIDAEHTYLNDGTKPESTERKADDPLPTPCGKCGFVKAPKTHACPACGFAPERQHAGEEVDAKLEELIPKAKAKLNRETEPEQKARFFAGLKFYGEEKGYKPGWAANQYKERFGVWPNAYKDVRPMEPDAFTHGWIVHKNIKFAKSQKS